ncbi:hypothetical protein, partial [Flavobacterium sp. HJSW_4]|uniref:hypothetical protein n=1 Tax=Flavobacterium sp. HJSW_4 TaxID=3344660 RepID=UPI0035F30160
FAVAGAKVEPFSAFPTLFPPFFHSFSKLFLNSLATYSLRFHVFSVCVRFFFKTVCFCCFSGASSLLFYWIFSLWLRFLMISYACQSFLSPENPLPKTDPLAPIEAEILFMAGFAMKRLERIAGNSS